MKKETVIKTADMVFSLILMGSYLYANVCKERFDLSLQFNIFNMITSFVFVLISVHDKRYGNALRQAFFAGVSGVNLYYIFSSG